MPQDDDVPDEKVKVWKTPVVTAFILTLLIIFGVWLWGYLADINGDGRTYTALSADEVGNFLAGLFAPITFVWVVVAVLMQTMELGHQRLELKLTRQEFKSTRMVAREQADFISTQTNLLVLQQKMREQEQADAKFGRIFSAMRENMRPDSVEIKLYSLDRLDQGVGIIDQDVQHLRFHAAENGSERVNILQWISTLTNWETVLANAAGTKAIIEWPGMAVFEKFARLTHELAELQPTLSPAQQSFADNVGIPQLFEIVCQVERLLSATPIRLDATNPTDQRSEEHKKLLSLLRDRAALEGNHFELALWQENVVLVNRAPYDDGHGTKFYDGWDFQIEIVPAEVAGLSDIELRDYAKAKYEEALKTVGGADAG